MVQQNTFVKKQKTPTGYWDTGLIIEKTQDILPKNQEQTIVLDKDQTLVLEYPEGSHTEFHILVKAGVHATIIDNIPAVLDQNITCRVEKDAMLTVLTLQKGNYIAHKDYVVSGTLTLFELNEGNAISRSEVALHEGAELLGTSMYLGDEKNTIDFGCSVRHVEKSNSQLFTKGVLRNALSIYDAAIIVEKDGAHSNAHQRADALLLTEGSEAKSSPQLFIGNNDITCSHAATTTHPDTELLFYLMSRGLAQETAHALMIKAFLWPVIEKLPSSAQKEIHDVVLKRIETYAGATHD